MNLLNQPDFNHRAQVESGLLEEQCGDLLRNFFRKLRKEKSDKRAILNHESDLLE